MSGGITYAAASTALLDGFAAQWAVIDPAWDQKTRIIWQDDKDRQMARLSWLRVVFGDLDGFNAAIGVLDTQISLFTVDIFVPLPEQSVELLGTLAVSVRSAVRKIVLPAAFIPSSLTFRRFPRTPDDFAQGRIAYSLQYTLPAVA